MRVIALAGLLAVAILVGAGAGYLVGVNTRGPQATSSTSGLAQPCPGKEVWNTSNSSSLIPVLLMQPNSRGYACVTYQTYWKGDPSYNWTGSFGRPFGPYQFYPFVIANEQCTKSGGGTTCGPDVSNAFRISLVSPSTANLTALTDYVVVLYGITSLNNSTGYYSNSVPYGCSSMPLAVGHAASDVNGSDFGPLICPVGGIIPVYPVSVSVTGMGVVYLKPW